MSARVRVYLIVAIAALAAAGTAIGVTMATRSPLPKRLAGAPPLSLDLRLQSGPQPQALAGAVKLYNSGKRDQAGKIFARYGSLEAQVGAAMSRWPHGGLQRLEVLGEQHPKSALVQLNLGLAELWTGLRSDAADAFQTAETSQPDTSYAVTAGTFLHPSFYRGLPPFTPSFAPPAAIAKLPAVQQLHALARAAAGGGVRERLLYGAALQELGKPVSAERQFELAAKAAPDDPQAQTAAAVGRFSKDDPSKAFSRLGALSKRFPKAATIRFHLGLMLVWMANGDGAKKQFRLAAADDPHGRLGATAQQFLKRLGTVGTK